MLLKGWALPTACFCGFTWGVMQMAGTPAEGSMEYGYLWGVTHGLIALSAVFFLLPDHTLEITRDGLLGRSLILGTSLIRWSQIQGLRWTTDRLHLDGLERQRWIQLREPGARAFAIQVEAAWHAYLLQHRTAETGQPL